MNSTAVDIKTMLEGESDHPGIRDYQEFFQGRTIFVGKKPPILHESTGVPTIVIYDTGGGEQNAKLAIDESTIQISSYSDNYARGYQALAIIKLALEGQALRRIEETDTTYVGIWAMTNIECIGREKEGSDIIIFVLNMRIVREPPVGDTGNRLRISPVHHLPAHNP